MLNQNVHHHSSLLSLEQAIKLAKTSWDYLHFMAGNPSGDVIMTLHVLPDAHPGYSRHNFPAVPDFGDPLLCFYNLNSDSPRGTVESSSPPYSLSIHTLIISGEKVLLKHTIDHLQPYQGTVIDNHLVFAPTRAHCHLTQELNRPNLLFPIIGKAQGQQAIPHSQKRKTKTYFQKWLQQKH